MAEYYYGASIEAKCADGRTRRATPRRYAYNGSLAADTWFSVPAFVRAHGRTVRGFITSASDSDPSEGMRFIAYTHRKNATAITSAQG